MSNDPVFMCSQGHKVKESEMTTTHCIVCGETMVPLSKWDPKVLQIYGIYSVTVMLVQKASGDHYSLEAGIADGKRNFDHHGNSSRQPAPCIDARIPIVPDGSVIEITHLDADTLIGILRMMSYKTVSEISQRLNDYGQMWRFTNEDLELMAKIDVNGSSFLPNNGLDIPVRQWMVGVLQLLRELEFPRWQGANIDVTDIVAGIISHSDEEIIHMGKEEMIHGEEAYQRSLVCKKNKIGLWHQKTPADSFDPSRPYSDDYNSVVIYREQFKAIGLYANPKTEIVLGGRTIAEIEFAGREQACGSPRGIEYSLKEAKEVFTEIETFQEATELFEKGWRLENWTDTDEEIQFVGPNNQHGYWADGEGRNTDEIFPIIGVENNERGEDILFHLSNLTGKIDWSEIADRE